MNASAAWLEQGQLTMRLPIVLYGRAHLTEGAEPHRAGAIVRHWSTPITAIDDWVREQGIARVSFIKVDVEGFEPQVLDGAASTSSRDLQSLLLEIEDQNLARYAGDAAAFTADVTRRWPEYGMYTWRDGGWVPSAAVTLEARNYLFATETALARR